MKKIILDGMAVVTKQEAGRELSVKKRQLNNLVTAGLLVEVELDGVRFVTVASLEQARQRTVWPVARAAYRRSAL